MEIRLLGLVEATHDGQDLPLGGPKPRALLSMLALEANAPVSVDRLIDGLWGDRPPATAPKLVQVLVSQLRKQLPDEAEIVTRGRGYELRVDPDAVDALRFERLVRSQDNGGHALQALALWRGPPLDDLANEPFAAPEIRRLEDLWLQAREAAIDTALAGGRHIEVAGELDDLVSDHPLREHLRAQQMLALYRGGRQADALEAFRQGRAFMLDEVGLEPGPELRQLNDAILRQDPDLDGPPARRGPTPARRSWRWLIAAAVVAAAGAAALIFAQSRGPAGLDRISEDAVGVIDPSTGRILAPQYSVGHTPAALATGAGSVWSANGRDGTVSRIDRASGAVTTIPVGGEPTALAFGGGSMWVANGETGRVDQVNSDTNRRVASLRAGNAPRGVAVTSDAVWVSSAVDGQVRRLDLTRSGQARSIDVAGGPAAITAGEGAVWVASEEDGIVTKLDPRSGAAVKPIRVGNAPAALAVGFGGVWVANRDDGTVMRIDAASDIVSATVTVGGSPVAVVAGLGAIWVADAKGTVLRIDPATHNVTHRTATGSTPSALTLSGGDVWAGATASPSAHRGGTLRYEIAPEPGAFPCGCVDPAEGNSDSGPVLSLVYDSLVTFRRVPGVGGSTLVADLAESVPQPSDGGRTYTFQLRRGLRFSDGTPVRPTDFRVSLQRAIRLGSAPFFDSIPGASACTPRRCDLSAGIETDDAARTITIHLAHPDAEFLYELVLPAVTPANVPARLLRRHAAPGTGPYAITAITPGRELRLTRNPYFHSWSSEARPDGYPDTIVASMSADAAAQVSAVQSDRSDAVVFAGGYSGLDRLAESRAIAFADASRVHAGPAPTNSYLFVNVGVRPFDDPRVGQALNFAIDRRRVLELAGGSSLNALSCQVLPPGLPGFTPACPYTRDVGAGGGWTGPDLARARRLVAASGTRGQRVEVLGPPKFAPVVRYAREVLEQLGYRARVRVISPVDAYYAYINDLRHHAQVMFFNWYGAFPTPTTFFEPLGCAHLLRASSNNENPAGFCDHGLDAGVTAALAAHGADANARWAGLDQQFLAAAPAVPLFSRRMLLLVSDRVGNAQLHQTIGPLLDQFWVR